MSDKFKAFWLGVFIIGGIGIITWLILFLRPSVGNGELTLKVRFSNIDKIEDGTRVTFAGKPIGEVSQIEEVPDPRKSPFDEMGNLYIYELTLSVDSSVHVYTYDEIIFASSGLLGEKSVAIIPKATPPGAPPAMEVTHDVLYARSTDKLTEALSQFGQLTDKFSDTLDEINGFISQNTNEINSTLKSLTGAADEVKVFAAQATQKDFIHRVAQAADSLAKTMDSSDLLLKKIKEEHLIERMGRDLDSLYAVTDEITQGKGTLGRLLHSDSLYLQITGMICKADTLLNDINNYGLLFQYDKGWQRTRTAKMNRMRQLCTPCDFYHYFDREICEISVSLNRVGQLLQTMECRDIPIQSECFAQSFRELMSQVECLRNSLKLYTEMLLGEYCEKCTCQ